MPVVSIACGIHVHVRVFHGITQWRQMLFNH